MRDACKGLNNGTELSAGRRDWLTRISRKLVSREQGQKATLLMRRARKGDENLQSAPGANKEVTHRQQQSWDAPEVLCAAAL
jgi:hypothetical protein